MIVDDAGALVGTVARRTRSLTAIEEAARPEVERPRSDPGAPAP